MEAFAYLIPYTQEWLNLIVRWLHVTTGIAWIGASFYFAWLDNAIRPPPPASDLAKKGVAGELWAVHGGGFYNPQKYLVAPAELPKELHWFKWEAYSTWLSGFALLIIVYYFDARAMLIDTSVADISSWQAICISLGALAFGWVGYDLLCRSRLGEHDLWFGLVMFALIVAVAYALTKTLSGRAAYIHIGAMMGTMMAGNVLMLIIPGQRKMVNAMMAGQLPNPVHGQIAKQRSVHNNYFTLPVLFIMISNHYAMTYRQEWAWLVLAVIMAAGVFIRHFFNLRQRGRVVWRYLIISACLLLAVAVAIAPAPPGARAAAADPIAQFAKVQAIITRRCVVCHAAHPTQAGITAAPGGILLDSAARIRQHAAQIYKQAVQLKAMPLGNLTNMADAERGQIGAWFETGAK